MSARKLQTEVERTLKKVSEGVEIFESIFDKIQTSTNQTQKEKLEVDLKSQIKKLQRLRDQIKTWVQSNDIKDKQPLIDNRKLIETQMERFKACEKEMKTKAFSKEGLNAAAKLDPKEQQKLELGNWITTMVDELSRQVEQTEAEIESLQLLKKKKDSDRSQRLDELETLNERRGWHVSRLELILRLLENGNLQVEAVADLKDDIAYFVESNTEEDFEEDEGIYDELNLQEEEELFGVTGDDIQSSHDSVSIADDTTHPPSVPPTPTAAPSIPLPPRTPAKEPPTPLAKAVIPEPTTEKSPGAKVKPVATIVPQRKTTLDSTTQRPVLLTTPTRAASGPSSASPAPRTTPAPLPAIRYAAAAAGANASPTTSSGPSTGGPAPSTTTAPPPGLVPAPPSISTNSNSDSRHASRSSSPEPPTAQKSVQPDSLSQGHSNTSAAPSPLMAPKVVPGLVMGSPVPSASSVNGAYAHSNGVVSSSPSVISSQSLGSGQLPPPPQQQQHQQQQSQHQPQFTSSPSPTPASLPGAGSGMMDDLSQQQQAQQQQQQQQQSQHQQQLSQQSERGAVTDPRLPSSLADLVTSFEAAKSKSMRRDNDLGGIHKILDAGFSNLPQPQDAEKPKNYVPRNPFVTPNYYPQEPSAQFANPALFSKFDVDTLFYIFYYCQGTYLQYLAASELKKQSWRFHKQYLTWFQRANEPQQITDEYEQGVYLYFDWEGSWCQRKKSDFRFEYKWLETE